MSQESISRRLNIKSQESIGRRYNQNKLRYELIPTKALARVAEVYTKGAEKYTIRDEKGDIINNGAENWRKGLRWNDTIASAIRHIEAWRQGNDIDPELNTRHLANAIWNLMALLEFEYTHPELDDRYKYNDVETKK